MAGMAANVSAFNTVFSFDLWERYVVKDKPDGYYLRVGRVAALGPVAEQAVVAGRVVHAGGGGVGGPDAPGGDRHEEEESPGVLRQVDRRRTDSYVHQLRKRGQGGGKLGKRKARGAAATARASCSRTAGHKPGPNY